MPLIPDALRADVDWSVWPSADRRLWRLFARGRAQAFDFATVDGLEVQPFPASHGVGAFAPPTVDQVLAALPDEVWIAGAPIGTEARFLVIRDVGLEPADGGAYAGRHREGRARRAAVARLQGALDLHAERRRLLMARPA